MNKPFIDDVERREKNTVFFVDGIGYPFPTHDEDTPEFFHSRYSKQQFTSLFFSLTEKDLQEWRAFEELVE